jgi:3-oxoacyl-[acyl-carrier-protein] synthase-3
VKTRFECCSIAGICATVPADSLALEGLQTQWDPKALANVIRMTGITRLRVAPPTMTASDLCLESAQRLLQELLLAPSDIDGIVFISQTPDYPTPATSAVLQDKLGLKQDVVNFDINQGCSGYIYALLQAEMLIHCGLCRTVLLCAGDTSTRFVGARDRSTRVVFGDAGSATIVTAGKNVDCFHLKTDGRGFNEIIVSAGAFRLRPSAETAREVECEDGNFRSAEQMFMNGKGVTNFAMREVPTIIETVLADSGMNKSEIGLFGLHQANRFMLDYLARKLGVTPEAMPFACGEIGNTSVASIPVMLALEAMKLREQNRLNKVVLCGFGVGLSWAAMTTTLTETNIMPLTELKC